MTDCLESSRADWVTRTDIIAVVSVVNCVEIYSRMTLRAGRASLET